MGKSKLLESLIVGDILAGRGWGCSIRIPITPHIFFLLGIEPQRGGDHFGSLLILNMRRNLSP